MLPQMWQKVSSKWELPPPAQWARQQATSNWRPSSALAPSQFGNRSWVVDVVTWVLGCSRNASFLPQTCQPVTWGIRFRPRLPTHGPYRIENDVCKMSRKAPIFNWDSCCLQMPSKKCIYQLSSMSILDISSGAFELILITFPPRSPLIWLNMRCFI